MAFGEYIMFTVEIAAAIAGLIMILRQNFKRHRPIKGIFVAFYFFVLLFFLLHVSWTTLRENTLLGYGFSAFLLSAWLMGSSVPVLERSEVQNLGDAASYAAKDPLYVLYTAAVFVGVVLSGSGRFNFLYMERIGIDIMYLLYFLILALFVIVYPSLFILKTSKDLVPVAVGWNVFSSIVVMLYGAVAGLGNRFMWNWWHLILIFPLLAIAWSFKERGTLSRIEFERPEILTGACGYNCLQCSEYKDGLCKGCEDLNKEGEQKCEIYECAEALGFKSCLSCNKYPNCERYVKTISKTHCPVEDTHASWIKAYRFVTSVSGTALIRYKPTSKFEEVVQGVVNAYMTKGQNVLLVSSAARTDIYSKCFSDSVLKGAIKLVKLSASARTDRFYKIGGEEKNVEVEGKVVEISVDWLEYLSEIIESLPKKSAIIFEPLSDLVLINGFEKTFKFIKKTIDYCVDEGIQMVSFINDEAHEETVRASFEGLFTNIANIVDDEFEIIK
ncbi:MAG: hypothetical protein ACE5HH_01525 [Candidatus Hydrothermarchaeales archaeon]